MKNLLLIIAAILLSSCADPCIDEVMSQAADAQQKTEFVHVRTNCGATTGFFHQIFIVAAGARYQDESPIFAADKAEHIAVKWLDAQTLEISSDSARIFNFKNFWQSKNVDNFQYVIQVKLHEEL
jgi:hypothetical protein